MAINTFTSEKRDNIMQTYNHLSSHSCARSHDGTAGLHTHLILSEIHSSPCRRCCHHISFHCFCNIQSLESRPHPLPTTLCRNGLHHTRSIRHPGWLLDSSCCQSSTN